MSIKTSRRGRKDMDLYRTICDFELGNLSTEEIPKKILDSLDDNSDSVSLLILAGLSSEQYNYFEVIKYYEKALEEIGIVKPDKYQAALYLALCICKDLLSKVITPEEFLKEIMTKVYHKTWNEFNSYKFVGDYLGLQQIIGTYYEIDDLKNELIQYKKCFNRKDELKKELQGYYNLGKEYINENERRLKVSSI
jgi:hypothetical protein